MDAPARIHFFIDENQPVRQLRAILEHRGHRVTPVQVGFKDPAILIAAEQEEAVIVTADKWFLTELFRFPAEHRRRYRKAGVVLVPGEWEAAQPRLVDNLLVIEAVYQVRLERDDRRMGINLSRAEIRIR
jgi:hypothetical protein